jgi:hypothetical protein
MGADTDLRADAARELAYGSLVRRILRTLDAARIPVMPLKGLYFAYWVYDDPEERLGGDIDLLVPPSAFGPAVEALRGAGFAADPFYDPRERTLVAPEMPIEIDLHRALFMPGRHSLPTQDLFSRGREDRDKFGAPVVLPDPYDACAHLIGHAASEHTPEHAGKTFRDLELAHRRFSLDPRRCAAHLERTGMGRAARYLLGLEGATGPFCRELRAALPADPVGMVLSRLACVVTQRSSRTALLSRAAGQLTGASLPRTAGTLAMGVANRLRLALGKSPVLRPGELLSRS